MATKLGLIQNALILIGDLPIDSLTGTTRAHTVANSLYDSTVQNELTKHRWGFARKKQGIKVDSTGNNQDAVTGTEWSAKYTLPVDLLTLIKINPSVPYQIIEGKIYSNMDQTYISGTNSIPTNWSPNVFIDYIYNVPESAFPAYFAKMLEYRLAMDFAPAIRDSAASMQMMAQQYENASRMARYADSQQHPITPIQDRPFLDVRF